MGFYTIQKLFDLQVDKYEGDCGATFSPQLHCNQDLRPQPPILKSGTLDNVCSGRIAEKERKLLFRNKLYGIEIIGQKQESTKEEHK